MPIYRAGLLKQLIEEKNLIAKDLERRLGYSNGGLAKAIEDNSKLKQERVDRLFSIFPDLNPIWLETGIGNMFPPIEGGEGKEAPAGFHRNARPKGTPIDIHTPKSGIRHVELSEGDYVMYPHRVSFKARAGYLVGWGDTEYIDSLPVYPAVVKDVHKGYYLWFDIDGDSMDDGTKRSIDHGSMALGRQINRSYWRSKFHLNQYPFYIIVTLDYGIVCKEIIEHDTEKGTITCHSLNPNKEMYPDFVLNLDECIQIFNVVKIERDPSS